MALFLASDYIEHQIEPLPDIYISNQPKTLGNPSGTSCNGRTSSNVLTPEEASEYCDHYCLKPADHDLVRKRKVFDVLLINTEVEMLEVHLGQMAPYGDYFVILEFDKTLTDHWELFKPWHDKIILRTIHLEELKEDGIAWNHETKSRNALYQQVFPTLVGEQAAATDDVLIVADVDEIPKPEIVRASRNCNIPPRVTTHARIYYYSFQWLSRGDWWHSQANLYRGSDTVLPEDLRKNANNHHLFHDGWHCSYCFSTVEELTRKITLFSHTEMDKPEYMDPDWVVDVTQRGLDIFGRDSSNFVRMEHYRDVPDYVRNNLDSFKFLLDCDPPNGNYRDYTPKSKPA
ncbi:family 17 glycosyltransferase [Colletotrichum caudatum]|nr:family 17 glycosyltransferase [Colletotrichum caudatum]